MKNNLIEQVGGIEKAKAIVDGAPSWASIYDPDVSDYFKGDLKGDRDYWLNDLRTAIAQYDSNPSNSRELESDDVRDIRNHISPNMKVVDV